MIEKLIYNFFNPANPSSFMPNNAATNLTTNVDDIAQPLVVLSSNLVSRDWEHARHCHRKGQLIYALRGVLNCEIDDGVWIVPPHCAVWIPGGLPHSARGAGETELHCFFIEPTAAANLPKNCCTLSVTPLLRELLLRAASFPAAATPGAREDRLIATLFDELAAAPVEHLHLPMPRDARLRRLATLLLEDPTDKKTMGHWAAHIAMSERSMSRLLLQEIGMSFGRWRRQLHVILSLQRLSRGDSVQTVALELGYENASGFVTMFRKALGKPPARYLADRIAGNINAGDEATGAPTIIFPNKV